MIVLFGDGVAELFSTLPRAVQKEAARSLDLIKAFPRMYPIRRQGLMRGYRYFVVKDYLFYYRLSSSEIHVSAIIPGRMRLA